MCRSPTICQPASWRPREPRGVLYAKPTAPENQDSQRVSPSPSSKPPEPQPRAGEDGVCLSTSPARLPFLCLVLCRLSRTKDFPQSTFQGSCLLQTLSQAPPGRTSDQRSGHPAAPLGCLGELSITRLTLAQRWGDELPILTTGWETAPRCLTVCPVPCPRPDTHAQPVPAPGPERAGPRASSPSTRLRVPLRFRTENTPWAAVTQLEKLPLI